MFFIRQPLGLFCTYVKPHRGLPPFVPRSPACGKFCAILATGDRRLFRRRTTAVRRAIVEDRYRSSPRSSIPHRSRNHVPRPPPQPEASARSRDGRRTGRGSTGLTRSQGDRGFCSRISPVAWGKATGVRTVTTANTLWPTRLLLTIRSRCGACAVARLSLPSLLRRRRVMAVDDRADIAAASIPAPQPGAEKRWWPRHTSRRSQRGRRPGAWHGTGAHAPANSCRPGCCTRP